MMLIHVYKYKKPLYYLFKYICTNSGVPKLILKIYIWFVKILDLRIYRLKRTCFELDSFFDYSINPK